MTRRGTVRRAATPMSTDELFLNAYALTAEAPPIRPAGVQREWLDQTVLRFGYRCLPLLMANQAGWVILNTHCVRATWTGGDTAEDLVVEYADALPTALPVVSYFGHGVLTFRIPILFRTPERYNLLVRGPANMPKPGAFALEGVVETDWSVATFTMNWKLLDPHRPVVFEKDEPICMIVPQQRGELERFRPVAQPISSVPALAKQFAEWASERTRFLGTRDPGAWQKDYLRGSIGGSASSNGHQTRLILREFQSR